MRKENNIMKRKKVEKFGRENDRVRILNQIFKK
jgi:hypothetical protein